MSDTNANLPALADILASARKGTFTGLIIRKKGVLKGKGDTRMVYGDDLVHATIVTGFSYTRLCERSLDRLARITAQGVLDYCNDKGMVDKDGAPITVADACKAIDDLTESLKLSAAGMNTSTTDHVYEPLVRDGVEVRGCRVYTGTGDPEDPKAPIPGTIYIQGLKIGETVLERAINGSVPPSKSRGDVVAKDALRRMLPIGRYVSYALEPGQDFLLRVGGAAAIAASKDGVAVKDTTLDDVRAIFGIAS